MTKQEKLDKMMKENKRENKATDKAKQDAAIAKVRTTYQSYKDYEAAQNAKARKNISNSQ